MSYKQKLFLVFTVGIIIGFAVAIIFEFSAQ